MKGLRSWKRSASREAVSAIPEVPKHRSKKNTKRWCKGIIGREHKYRYVEWLGSFKTIFPGHTQVYSVEECENCRKQGKLISPSYSDPPKLGPGF